MLLERLDPYLLSVEGQITQILLRGECVAGDIYSHVSASQPTVSKRLARMIDEGKIEHFPSPNDRRFSIYRIAHAYRAELTCDHLHSIRSFDQ